MSQREIDEKYMRRALELAAMAGGYAAPNPMVGAVVVHNDKIIGEGYHRRCGEPHAEVNAIASVKNRELLRESTIYVTLEPCSHYGKTPPCADLIINSGLKRVVVACFDSFDKVDGKGIAKIREAGIEIEVGVLEKEAQELNRRFFTFHTKKRPFIILKWAQTADGFLDNDRKASEPMNWLTGKQCKRMVHKMRAMESAIMVGSKTVERDNPQLTIRNWSGENPIRVVIDRELRLKGEYKIYDGSANTLIYNSIEDRINSSCKTEYILANRENFLEELLSDLYKRGLTSLIVEGGRELLSLFIEKELYDEALIFVSPISLRQMSGGENKNGIVAPLIPYGKRHDNELVEGVLVKRVVNY